MCFVNSTNILFLEKLIFLNYMIISQNKKYDNQRLILP